jgi:hypothetical protein
MMSIFELSPSSLWDNFTVLASFFAKVTEVQDAHHVRIRLFVAHSPCKLSIAVGTGKVWLSIHECGSGFDQGGMSKHERV